MVFVSLSLRNKSGSILKTKSQDKCWGVQPCARETRGPALTSDGSQSAAAYVPELNLRLEFPPKPCQWAQLELFISWWMGLNNSERSERESVLI